MNRSEFLQIIIKEIGAFQMKHWRTNIDHNEKSSPMDLVSFVDTESERLFREGIEKHFPDDEILGEESYDPGYDYESCERLWIIDPLDGTLMYLRGMKIFGVMIAYVEGGKTRLSGIYLPALNEIYFSEGNGSYRNDIRISVSDVSMCSQALLDTSFGRLIHSEPKNLKSLQDFEGALGKIYSAYTSAYRFSTIASGSGDATIFHPPTLPWDMAAGAFLVEQAGGKVTKLNGEKWNCFSGGCLASNSHIHNELVGLLNML